MSALDAIIFSGTAITLVLAFGVALAVAMNYFFGGGMFDE